MKNFDAINDALDVEASIVPVEETPKPVQKPKEKDDINKDYEYSRGNLYSLIEKGQEAVNGILELAQESDSARAYEVAGQLIKSVADTTDKLIDLQKKMKDIEEGRKCNVLFKQSKLFCLTFNILIKQNAVFRFS